MSSDLSSIKQDKTIPLQFAFLFSCFNFYYRGLRGVNIRYTLPGVTVRKGQEEIEVRAPVVISNAGIFNTFQRFLPKEIQDKPGRIQHRQQSGNVSLNLPLNLLPGTLSSMQRFNHCWVWCVTVWLPSWSSLVWMDPRRSWALFQLTSGCIKTMI